MWIHKVRKSFLASTNKKLPWLPLIVYLVLRWLYWFRYGGKIVSLFSLWEAPFWSLCKTVAGCILLKIFLNLEDCDEPRLCGLASWNVGGFGSWGSWKRCRFWERFLNPWVPPPWKGRFPLRPCLGSPETSCNLLKPLTVLSRIFAWSLFKWWSALDDLQSLISCWEKFLTALLPEYCIGSRPLRKFFGKLVSLPHPLAPLLWIWERTLSSLLLSSRIIGALCLSQGELGRCWKVAPAEINRAAPSSCKRAALILFLVSQKFFVGAAKQIRQSVTTWPQERPGLTGHLKDIPTVFCKSKARTVVPMLICNSLSLVQDGWACDLVYHT